MITKKKFIEQFLDLKHTPIAAVNPDPNYLKMRAIEYIKEGGLDKLQMAINLLAVAAVKEKQNEAVQKA